MKQPLLIVHTGKGKGKTTAALGLALRAAGHGMKICIIQFIKGAWNSGELVSLERFGDLIDVHMLGRGFIKKSDDLEAEKAHAREAWEFATKTAFGGDYDMAILDELNYLLHYGMVDENEVVAFLNAQKGKIHIVVTGRRAPKSLLRIADLVTEMKAVKHPYDANLKAQKGIEF